MKFNKDRCLLIISTDFVHIFQLYSNPNGGPEGTGVRMRSFHMTKTTPHYVTVTQRDVIQENHNKQLKKLEGA